ncbi:MAG TPA: hypothetical protein VNP72_06575, partial [Longimicrobium sp.]|nr:hypothetical protein [Longimicrobium sp.]
MLFALVAVALLYLAAVEDRGWICWAGGSILLLFLPLTVIPEWRDSFGSGLGRIRVRSGSVVVQTGRDARDMAIVPAPEKAPERVLPVNAPARSAIAEDLSPRILDGLKHVTDPLVYWSLAVGLIRNENYGSARAVLDAGLERDPYHPKLLISAGYLWARLNEQSRAIEAATRAVAGARE